MQTIRVLIVENDVLIAEDTSQKLSRLGYKVTDIVADADTAKKSIEEDLPNVVLMDIDLDGAVDGIELAKQIHEKYQIPIIYLTDLNDPRTLNRTQNTHLSFFMNKPFNEHLLAYNIELACKRTSDDNVEEKLGVLENALFLKPSGKSGKRVKVGFESICYIKASRSYSEIYVKSSENSNELVKYEPAVSMSEVFKHLSTPPFLQVHRSYVVNLNYVQALEEDDLLILGIPIPMGPSFKAEVKSRLKIV